MRQKTTSFLLLLGVVGGVMSISDVHASRSRIRAVFACTEKENWKLSRVIPKDMRKDFLEYLDNPYELSKVYRIAHSKMNASDKTAIKIFGHYWIARAQFEEALSHLAFQKFRKILSVPMTREISGIQIAALSCVNKIQKQHSSFRLPWKSIVKIRQGLIENAGVKLHRTEQNVVEQAVLRWTRNYVGTDIEVNELASLMPLIRRGSKKRFLVRALISVKRREYSEAARDLRKVLNLAQSQRESGAASESLGFNDEYFVEVLRLTRSRVLFEAGKLSEAVSELRKMEKTSSEFMHALQQRAWVYLVQGKYGDAIGMALTLHSTGFANTFTPAALLVVAISFNELCQYPSAQRVLRRFGNQYGRIYKWMRERRKGNMRQPYEYVSAHLKGEKAKIPRVVLSEWLRSQVFIAKQEELNLLFAEKAVISSLKDERRRGLLAYRRANFMIKRLKRELKSINRSTASQSVRKKRAGIKQKIKLYEGEKKGIMAFKNDLMRLQSGLPKLADRLVKEINEDLISREKRMMKKIGSLFEIAQLLQVELLEGAGEDMVWRSAHRDYFNFSQEDRETQMKSMQSKGYSWGDGPEVTDGLEEVWEDELGTLQANVANRCKTKDNYLNKIGGK